MTAVLEPLVPVPVAARSVSVVIPCHNYAAYLDACLASALSQDGVAVDVTIVDDASTDGSLDIARRWATNDHRVSVIAHERNAGHIATFNEALASGRSPFVVKLDPDDILPPGSLRRSVDALQAHPDASFVYGSVEAFHGEVPAMPATPVRRVQVWPGQRWLRMRAQRVRNVILQPEVMIRRAALEKTAGHRDDLPASSDFHLWMSLAAVGSVARIHGPVQGLYRVHQASMQRTIHAGKLADLRARVDAFDRFCDDHRDALAEPDEFRAVARAALARDALRLAAEELDDGADAGEYLAAAAQLDPSVTRTCAWRMLRRRLSQRRGAAIATRLSAIERAIKGRVRWRRWRRFGV